VLYNNPADSENCAILIDYVFAYRVDQKREQLKKVFVSNADFFQNLTAITKCRVRKKWFK